MTGSRGDGSRRGRTGIAAIALTLLCLSVVVVLGSYATERAAARTQRAVVLNTAFQKAATGVAAEESLERKYLLEPNPTTIEAHHRATEDVRIALTAVRRHGGPNNRRLVTDVLAQHDRYMAAAKTLFQAADRGQSLTSISVIDDNLVDPVFRRIEERVNRASAEHAAQALHEVTRMRLTDRLVLALDVATLLAGMTLIAVAAVALTRSQRQLQSQSDLNRHQALHDSLTGLPNRALFQDRTAQALEAAKRSGSQVAVMLVDLNRFKDVNDTLGHHYGDLLLWQVAQRFTATLRGGDSVARLGGDEFAVLLSATTADDAIAAATRLTNILNAPFTVKDISLDVDASIGIALADTDVETALRRADVAMYEAKIQHLPFAMYELTRDDNTVARLALLGDLRRAITNGELVLHYQPKVSTTTGEVHSVEGLVRWQHPTRGLLTPGDFIPTAEVTAVIHPLTNEILRQALTQAKTWLDQGRPIPVAVNISARSLLDLSFPAEVQRELDAIGVPAHLLTLELTEGAIMTDPGRAVAVLEALNTMGICLSIDDFGTGYSSMAYLKALPVRELKIDRSFVIGMTTDDSDLVLVRSAVDLGHNLGLHVVAEGVEDAQTLDALAAMGCDLVQGNCICPASVSPDLEVWLGSRSGTTPTLAGR